MSRHSVRNPATGRFMAKPRSYRDGVPDSWLTVSDIPTVEARHRRPRHLQPFLWWLLGYVTGWCTVAAGFWWATR